MKRREAGQTLVESALSLLVFLSMILGIVDIGQLFYTRYMLTGQVRTVARQAAIEPMEDAAIRHALAPNRVEITRTGEKITVAIVDIQAPGVTPWFSGLVSGGRPIVESVPLENRR